MLLHNQRNAVISWEADGREYTWQPYGACDLPDVFVPLIRAQGFPVDVVPVPPKEKAERAAAEQTDSEMALALEAARKETAAATVLVTEAKAAAEAADQRAATVRAELDAANERVRVLEEELRSVRGDSAAYEKLLSESAAKISKLEEELKIAKPTAAGSKPKDK
ncbi:hypothetical protein [Caudoviricetes sp.]|nr:hypothetical protein [Caudoviricetes sp.]